MRNHPCFSIWNTLGNALIDPGTGGVRHTSSTGLLCHCAGGVRHPALADLVNVSAFRVRHSLAARHWDLTTDRIGNLLLADLGNHPCAADFLLDYAGNPAFAADLLRRPWAANHFGTARVAGVRNTLLNHRTGHTLGVSFPPSAAYIHCLLLSHRLKCCVTTLFVASLCFSSASRITDISIAGLIDRLADVVAARAITGLIDWLAHCITDIAIAGLIDRFANVAVDSPVARLRNRPTHSSRHITVAGFVNGLTNRVAFVAVACLVDVANALNGYCFRAVVVDDTCRFHCLGFPDNFTNRSVLHTTANFCLRKITGTAGTGRNAVVTNASEACFCHATA